MEKKTNVEKLQRRVYTSTMHPEIQTGNYFQATNKTDSNWKFDITKTEKENKNILHQKNLSEENQSNNNKSPSSNSKFMRKSILSKADL